MENIPNFKRINRAGEMAQRVKAPEFEPDSCGGRRKGENQLLKVAL